MSLIFDLFPLISHSEFDSNVIQMLENVPAFLGYLKFPGTCHVPIFLQTQLQSQVSFFVSFWSDFWIWILIIGFVIVCFFHRLFPFPCHRLWPDFFLLFQKIEHFNMILFSERWYASNFYRYQMSTELNNFWELVDRTWKTPVLCGMYRRFQKCVFNSYMQPEFWKEDFDFEQIFFIKLPKRQFH